jgi:hypothetical protein
LTIFIIIIINIIITIMAVHSRVAAVTGANKGIGLAIGIPHAHLFPSPATCN